MAGGIDLNTILSLRQMQPQEEDSDQASNVRVPSPEVLVRRLERFNKKRDLATHRLPPEIAALAAQYGRAGTPNA